MPVARNRIIIIIIIIIAVTYINFCCIITVYIVNIHATLCSIV